MEGLYLSLLLSLQIALPIATWLMAGEVNFHHSKGWDVWLNATLRTVAGLGAIGLVIGVFYSFSTIYALVIIICSVVLAIFLSNIFVNISFGKLFEITGIVFLTTSAYTFVFFRIFIVGEERIF